jgi:hypothetical protein
MGCCFEVCWSGHTYEKQRKSTQWSIERRRGRQAYRWPTT